MILTGPRLVYGASIDADDSIVAVIRGCDWTRKFGYRGLVYRTTSVVE